MKKYISSVLAVLMLCQSVYAGDISVNLDGENVEFAAQSPVIVEGRTLIPLRGVFEKLGYEIGWDGDTKTATFVKDLTIVKVTANAPQLTVGGSAYPLDVPGQIINGSMMLPLRAVGEATGLEVEWDSETKTVVLSSETSEENAETSVSNNNTATELTEDIKFYIDLNIAVAFAYAYMDHMFECVYVNGDVDYENMDYDRLIKYNNSAIAKTKEITENKYNKDILEAIRNTAKNSTELFTKIRDIIKSGKKGEEYIDEEFLAFVDGLSDLDVVIEDSSDDFMDYNKAYDWDYDDLNDEQTKEVRAYQKKVGAILNEALAEGVSSDANKKQGAERIRKAAEEIRENVSKLTPPDFAGRDDDILFAGCDILNEAADLYEKMSDEDIDIVYFKSLILTFEACAKSCAGDYYLIKSYNN